jgi:hypothetical protein
VRAIFDTDMERDQIRVLTDALGLAPNDAARRFDLLARYLGAGPTAVGSETAGASFENTVLRNSATAPPHGSDAGARNRGRGRRGSRGHQ